MKRLWWRYTGWRWKRRNPIKHQILEAAITAHLAANDGKLFPDLETDFENRWKARLYGELAYQEFLDREPMRWNVSGV